MMNAQDFRRSNGRIPACEPCKQRKVACDHNRPTCSRCVKRGQETECVYLGHESSRPFGSRRHAQDVSPASPTGLSATSRQTTSPDAASTSAGYLGFTSFSSVFKEAGMLADDVASAADKHDSVISSSAMPIRVRDACVALLQRIPEMPRAAQLFCKRPAPLEGWMKLIAERLLDSLFQTFGQYLGRSRKPARLVALANQLCANTIASLSDNEQNFEAWISQFSGSNMRWESIGILFCFWDEDSSTSRADVDGWASVNRESLHICVDICKSLSRGNSLMLYLTHRLMVAESLFSGDASLATWRLHGEVVSLLTFLGFHAETNNAEYHPTFVSEMKRKLCAIVYIYHVVCVSFTGRPPLINNTYLTTPLPLDLDDKYLALDQVDLTTQFDARGWSKEGGPHSATFIRAWSMLAAVREEIFGIALGKSYGSTVVHTLTLLKKRELDTVSTFPPSLHHKIEDLVNSGNDIIVLYSRLVIRLEHLQNLFFVERLLLRHGQIDEGSLLALSFEMVTCTLYFWTHLDRLLAVRRDCEWLVMSYAAPPGGILCMELLKPRLDIAEKTGISRSKIVQKLSLLVGYLDWVNPTGPNGKLCQTCKLVIEHVLDQAINDATVMTCIASPEPHPDLEFPLEMNFNLDLLDTFEWMRPEST
ncbi:hypothetical protein GGR57DRAFT_314712 [Xylariaceae sp. FL1272]|nr:hypothetical protein GGR57DRAFT_314712 [Xylariaceae sp. FL1272]